ncbi:MAG: insulinase family protein [Fuerstiella sp.]|nr:insulinase family protein [Fuerstiella sp.]
MTHSCVSTQILSNGVTVVVEQMADVQSAAVTILQPAGSVYDQPGRSGTAALLSEMLTRGAGGYSTRELSASLDNLGVQRSVSPGLSHLTLSAATTADRIIDAVPLLAAVMTNPHLDDEHFASAQDLVRQSLHALEDEPQQRLGQYLRRCSYDAPWGNPSGGTLEDIDRITCDDVRRHFNTYARPQETIIGVAGNISPTRIGDAIESSFGSWTGGKGADISTSPCESSPSHINHESAQTHIGLAWPSVPYGHERYFDAWAAVSILSGGMSSRLFTNVREKRGLCYSVSASLNTLKNEARVFGYAGTTTERAQETLEATVAEIRGLHQGLTIDELRRCQAQAKSSLIMQQESTMSRSSSLARDTWHLGRVLMPDEIRNRVDKITVQDVHDYTVEYAPKEIVLVTIGPEPLNADCLQSATTAV